MSTTGNEGFARAVATALDTLGTGLLCRPLEFVGAVSDLYDPGSPEVTVLFVHACDEMLRPFVEGARAGTTAALGLAARRVELWLHDVRRADAEDAHVVAWGIARGVAAHLGVEVPLDPEVERRRQEEEERRRRAEAARKAAEEERIRREREEAARRAAEEARIIKEQEDRRKAAEEAVRQASSSRTMAGTASHETAASKQDDTKPRKPGIGIVLAVITCLIVAVALVANSQPGGSTNSGSIATTTKNVSGQSGSTGSAVSKKKSNEGSVSGVDVRKGVSKYSWDELKKLSNAIAGAKSDKAGMKIAKEYHLVDSDGKLQGDMKAVKLTDGTKTSVRILGFRQDELADGGVAGITFEFADVPTTHCMNPEPTNEGDYVPAMHRTSAERTDSGGYIRAMPPFVIPDCTNEGGWEKSEMRAWLNSDFMALLPDDLRGCVESVAKRTNNKGCVEQEGDTSVVTKTDDRLWLLSMGEVYGKDLSFLGNDEYSGATYDAEGIQYQLYADQGVTRSSGGICNKGGAYYEWWLRSPCAEDERGFMCAGYGSYGHASDSGGVSPGFCL